MPWGDIESNVESVEKHHFATHKPLQMEKWLKDVACEYVKLRTECNADLPNVLDVAGVGVFDIAALKARMAQATVPADDTKRGAFSVTRSDLSEVLAYLTLERNFETQIAYKLVRDRELPQLTGRGIDVIGIEEGTKLFVVLGEIKFSDEDSSPNAPQVVDASKDCMRVQHLGHISELNLTLNKIWECARRAKDSSLQSLLMAAALQLESGASDEVEIVSCCVLVRPEQRYSPGDYGSFKKDPNLYAPANVRFLVWMLPGDMESILTDWSLAIDVEKTNT